MYCLVHISGTQLKSSDLQWGKLLESWNAMFGKVRLTSEFIRSQQNWTAKRAGVHTSIHQQSCEKRNFVRKGQFLWDCNRWNFHLKCFRLSPGYCALAAIKIRLPWNALVCQNIITATFSVTVKIKKTFATGDYLQKVRWCVLMLWKRKTSVVLGFSPWGGSRSIRNLKYKGRLKTVLPQKQKKLQKHFCGFLFFLFLSFPLSLSLSFSLTSLCVSLSHLDLGHREVKHVTCPSVSYLFLSVCSLSLSLSLFLFFLSLCLI